MGNGKARTIQILKQTGGTRILVIFQVILQMLASDCTLINVSRQRHLLSLLIFVLRKILKILPTMKLCLN